MLITSRETKRWVIPKGNAPVGAVPHLAAAEEAEEEAGVTGAASPSPLGSYRYRKKRGNGASLMVDVEVFPLAVSRELSSWKEKAERERRWFTLSEAADAVEEEDLRDLMRSFAASEFKAAARRGTILETVAKKSGISNMFGWFQRLLPKQGNFFDLFEAHVKTIVAGADALSRVFHDTWRDYTVLLGGPGSWHRIEHDDEDDGLCGCGVEGDHDHQHEYDDDTGDSRESGELSLAESDVGDLANSEAGGGSAPEDDFFALQLIERLVFGDPAVQQAIDDGED